MTTIGGGNDTRPPYGVGGTGAATRSQPPGGAGGQATSRPFSTRCQAEIDRLNLVVAGMQTSLDAAAVAIDGLRRDLGDAQIQHAADLARIQELEDELHPPSGTLFGWFAGSEKYPTQETKAQMRTRCNALFGVSHPPVERIFNEGAWTVPAADTPAILSISQDPVRVASGEFDGQITTLCQGDWEGWITVNHECDQSTRPYTPAAQKAALAHMSDVVRAAGNPRVKMTMILMSWTLSQGVDRWRDWYPGSQYLDALGFDAYFRPSIPHSAADVYGKALATARGEGLPLLICETSLGAQGAGGTGFTEQEWTDYTADAIAYLNNPDVAAVTWFEVSKSDGIWNLQYHPAALAIYKAAVAASLT